jgi:hypothetical protein
MKATTNLKSWALVTAFAWASLATTVEAHALSSQSSVSQTIQILINEVALVASTGPDTLVLDVDNDRDGTLRLQYTTTNASGAHRSIFVNWNLGDRAPRGTSLRIRAMSVPTGCGSASPEVVVTERPAAVIHSIPSCFTGRGSSGAQVEYRLSIDDPSRLDARDTTTVTLVFTISEDS